MTLKYPLSPHDLGRYMLIAAIALMLLFGLVLVVNNKYADKSTSTSTDQNIQSDHRPASTSPDPVKSQSGSNSDTTPSTSGTGSGSDNSLLGQ